MFDFFKKKPTTIIKVKPVPKPVDHSSLLVEILSTANLADYREGKISEEEYYLNRIEIEKIANRTLLRKVDELEQEVFGEDRRLLDIGIENGCR